jgi:hypothetical protein
MAGGDFARLRAWAENDGYEIEVSPPASRADGTWHVAVELLDPVKLRATASHRDIDSAAEQVIGQLLAVGETVP